MLGHLKSKLLIVPLFIFGISLIFLYLSIPIIVKTAILKNSIDSLSFSSSWINIFILLPVFILILIWGFLVEKLVFESKRKRITGKITEPKKSLLKILFEKYKVFLLILVMILFILPTYLSILPRSEIQKNGIVKYGIFNNIIEIINFNEIKEVQMGIQKKSHRGGISYEFYYSFTAEQRIFTFNLFKDEKAIFTIYELIKNSGFKIQVKGKEYVPIYEKQSNYMNYGNQEKILFNSWFKSET